jgi:hypothetical protein
MASAAVGGFLPWGGGKSDRTVENGVIAGYIGQEKSAAILIDKENATRRSGVGGDRAENSEFNDLLFFSARSP